MSFTVGAPTTIASAPGADGIIFAPDGTLLIGGQGANNVYQYTPGGSLVSTAAAGEASFHLALDPSGTSVYSNTFGGGISVMPLVGNVVQNGIVHSLTGDDTGITSEAYVPGTGWFYVNGQPNGGGNVGTIDLTTFKTTRFASGVTSAHGLNYDPFTKQLVLFGAGYVGQINPLTHALTQHSTGVCDFDQGGVDGNGHAVIAGCNGITFIDYSASGDITSATNPIFTQFGFNSIDDVAPLSGLGSNLTPEPGSIFLLAGGLISIGLIRFRHR